jgi:uncharacterized protein (DUF433 family)
LPVDTIADERGVSQMAIRQEAPNERIVRNPRILGGEPIVRGTRIGVRSIILAAREYDGARGVLPAYPQLCLADVQDAFAFYDAHAAEIDRYIQANLVDD